MSRANQWFVPGEGIAREVITADIQRYLGPDALVRPGSGTAEYEGRAGYWITAYRTLTSQMIQDLKLDSQRWQQEKSREESGRRGGVAYQDSATHAARQYHGPSEGYDSARHASRQQYSSPSYATSEHYTTTPTAAYGAPHQGGYQAPAPSHAAPRTQPDPYATYQQPSGREPPSYATTPSYSYPQQPPQDPYGRTPAAPPSHGYATPSVAAPGYYIASDGRQYPLAQQPQQPQGGQRRRG